MLSATQLLHVPCSLDHVRGRCSCWPDCARRSWQYYTLGQEAHLELTSLLEMQQQRGTGVQTNLRAVYHAPHAVRQIAPITKIFRYHSLASLQNVRVTVLSCREPPTPRHALNDCRKWPHACLVHGHYLRTQCEGHCHLDRFTGLCAAWERLWPPPGPFFLSFLHLMADADEEFDIFDEQERAIGRASRKAAHQQGLLHKAVYVFLFSHESLLLQRRSLKFVPSDIAGGPCHVFSAVSIQCGHLQHIRPGRMSTPGYPPSRQ